MKVTFKLPSAAYLIQRYKILCSRGFVTDGAARAEPTDGAARGEAKLAWAIPSRDRGRQSQTCLSYAESRRRKTISQSPCNITADLKSAQTFRTDYNRRMFRAP